MKEFSEEMLCGSLAVKPSMCSANTGWKSSVIMLRPVLVAFWPPLPVCCSTGPTVVSAELYAYKLVCMILCPYNSRR